MAYGKKYSYNFYNKKGEVNKIELHQLGYLGASSVVAGGDNPKLNYKAGGKDNPDVVIQGSALSFSLLADTSGNIYQDLIESNFKDFKVFYYIDDVLQWVGFLLPENITTSLFDEKYFINLTASDSLAELKDIEFSSSYDGYATVMQIVQACIDQTDIKFDYHVQLNILENNLSSNTNCVLSEATINVNRFRRKKDGVTEFDSCHKVLTEVLKPFHVNFKQSDGKYYITNIYEGAGDLIIINDVWIINKDTLLLDGKTSSNYIHTLDNADYFNPSSEVQRIRPKKRIETTFFNRNEGGSVMVDWKAGWTYTGDITGVAGADKVTLSGEVIRLADGSTPFNGSGITDSFNIESFEQGDYVEINFDTKLITDSHLGFSGEVILLDLDNNIVGREYTPDFNPWINKNINVKLEYASTGAHRVEIRFFRAWLGDEELDTGNSFDLDITNFSTVVHSSGSSNITFDKIFRAENPNTTTKDLLERELQAGDSIMYSDIGSIKINDTNTSSWTRFDKNDDKSLQELYTYQHLLNYQSYKNFYRISIYNHVKDRIQPHNIIEVQGKKYQIVRYGYNLVKNLLEVELFEILTNDITYNFYKIQKNSVDGSGGSGSTSTGGSTVIWGNITGDIGNQQDLKDRFVMKAGHIGSGVFVSDSLGNLIIDPNVTATELNRLDGVTANVQTQLNEKLSITQYEAEKHFRGSFLSETALKDNIFDPAPVAGNYANVDPGAGEDISRYVWDNTDSTWVLAGGAGMVQSVNNQLPDGAGNVDVITTNIPEGTNLYFTDQRAKDAVSFNSLVKENDSITRLTGLNSSINKLVVYDGRTMPGSDGTAGYIPEPQATIFDKRTLPIFATAAGEGWRGILTVKGWSGTSYAAWQIAGTADPAADENFYLRSGVGTAWNTWRKIYHDGNDGNLAKLDASNVFTGTRNTFEYLRINKHLEINKIVSTQNGHAKIYFDAAYKELRFYSADDAGNTLSTTNSLQVHYNGAYKEVYHKGNDSNLAKLDVGNSFTGSQTINNGGLYTNIPSGSGWGLQTESGGLSNWSGIWFDTNNSRLLLRNSSGLITTDIKSDGSTSSISGEFTIAGNTAWHAGNLTPHLRYNNTTSGYISAPEGAYYATITSGITGAIKIKLPTYLPADMLGFVVDIFDHAGGDGNGESVTLLIKGYAYTDSLNSWGNTTVTTLSKRSDRDYTVRFGHDGFNSCVWIGETGSTWNYPQVQVRDFFAGYKSDINAYATGWNISFVTAFDTVDHSSTGNYPYASNSGLLDGLDSSAFAQLAKDNNYTGSQIIDPGGDVNKVFLVSRSKATGLHKISMGVSSVPYLLGTLDGVIVSRLNFNTDGTLTDVNGNTLLTSASQLGDADTLDGLDSTDFAQLAKDNTFTGWVEAPNYIAPAGNDLLKYKMWGNQNYYGIGMTNAYSHGTVTDYAMTFSVQGGGNRGFIFGNRGVSAFEPSLSINAATGDLNTKGTITSAGKKVTTTSYLELADASIIAWDWPSALMAEVWVNGNRELDIMGDVAGNFAFIVIHNTATVTVTITLPLRSGVRGVSSFTIPANEIAYVDWRSNGFDLFWKADVTTA
jgi:hypothetical protein